MEMTIRAESKEVTALVVVIQGRQAASGTSIASEREHLIREYESELASLRSDESAGVSDREWLIQEYERRLALLKSGASLGEMLSKGKHKQKEE